MGQLEIGAGIELWALLPLVSASPSTLCWAWGTSFLALVPVHVVLISDHAVSVPLVTGASSSQSRHKVGVGKPLLRLLRYRNPMRNARCTGCHPSRLACAVSPCSEGSRMSWGTYAFVPLVWLSSTFIGTSHQCRRGVGHRVLGWHPRLTGIHAFSP